MDTHTHTHTSFRNVSASPFQSSAQFSEDDFCSKYFIPEGTAYSKSCNKIYRKLNCKAVFPKVGVTASHLTMKILSGSSSITIEHISC